MSIHPPLWRTPVSDPEGERTAPVSNYQLRVNHCVKCRVEAKWTHFIKETTAVCWRWHCVSALEYQYERTHQSEAATVAGRLGGLEVRGRHRCFATFSYIYILKELCCWHSVLLPSTVPKLESEGGKQVRSPTTVTRVNPTFVLFVVVWFPHICTSTVEIVVEHYPEEHQSNSVVPRPTNPPPK